MVEINHFIKNERAASALVKTVGIIYCSAPEYPPGRELEQKADLQTGAVARAVQSVLGKYGYQAQPHVLQVGRLDDLCLFDWIFNLADSVYGFPLSEFEIAREMEKIGVRYTGSNASTLEICHDKARTKAEMQKIGIRTPAYTVVNPGDPGSHRLHYPLIVKPNRQDGSYGITKDSVVWDATELEKQVLLVHELYQQEALVEEFIAGRDITASVIGNGIEAEVLPLSEITYDEDHVAKFLTFNAKWMPELAEYKDALTRCPCTLEPEVETLIKEAALRIYRFMGCREFARIDFRLRGPVPFMLEVNPNPCIDPEDSGFVNSAKAAGYSYERVILKILEDAIQNRCPPG